MATRSRIAIEHQDGTVTSIYCHFDGYLEHNGKILQNHFQDREKVEQLIALGDLSSLYESIENTIAYHRDRGEDHCYQTHSRVEALFEMDSSVSYIYCLTKDDIWLVSQHGLEAENLKEKLEE